MRFAASITLEEGTYVAQCLEVDVAGEGATREEAVESLKRELEAYLHDSEAVAPPKEPAVSDVEIVVTEEP